MANRCVKNGHYHYSPEKCASVPHRNGYCQKANDSKSWWNYGERGTVVHCWCQCRLAQIL
jgi:hypothetical protein